MTPLTTIAVAETSPVVVNVHAVFKLPTLPALIVCSAAALRVL